jgi:hypothetical protein
MCLEHGLGELPEVERDAELLEPDGVFEYDIVPVLCREVDGDLLLVSVDINPITPVAPALETSVP